MIDFIMPLTINVPHNFEALNQWKSKTKPFSSHRHTSPNKRHVCRRICTLFYDMPLFQNKSFNSFSMRA